ncbi:hypothetical protein A5714_13180 [Mycobacterium sp. E2462]|uniref:PaaI family thioesterase n=1 Tax=Mycobacterium sp. E2462 TaxID=1834133 RepID=UPI0007FF96CB|nr:PaaI family thioesterase [Mycobacterium sp. E2462]OBI14729.1 hypothetical protein A5714_13180 [Mycobacterium sp. E2462]
MLDQDGYLGLFGGAGAALSEAEWIAHANSALPGNLSALRARMLEGSRAQRCLRVCYEPGPGSYNFVGLSGGAIAEMLDQAVTHCGSLVTSHPCPTLTMTVNYLRAGTGAVFVADARVDQVTSATVLLSGELSDSRGRRIASASAVSQLIKDMTRLA